MTKFIVIFIMTFVFILSATNIHNSESTLANYTISLVNDTVKWDTRNYATFDESGDSLNLAVDLNSNETIYNRIYTIVNVTDSISSPTLELSYLTNSSQGNPRFIFETRVNNSEPGMNNSSPFLQYYDFYEEKPLIYSIDVGNTLGYQTNRTYELPDYISNSTTEVRFYIITKEPTTADFVIRNATILGN